MTPSMKPTQAAVPFNRAATKPMTQPATTVAASRPVRSEKPAPSESEIAVRAYEIWLAAGQPAGQSEKHWYEAERQLRGS